MRFRVNPGMTAKRLCFVLTLLIFYNDTSRAFPSYGVFNASKYVQSGKKKSFDILSVQVFLNLLS